jgi:ATP-dependent DNA helicase RecG
MEILTTKYLKAAISYQGIQRIESLPVPEPALREAILNAIIHRDYAVGAPIQIRVYPDKLAIWNPGELPEGWTMKKLFGHHSSKPYNPLVANAFFRAGEIESWGRGIERILDACREAGAPEPLLEFDARDVWVTFPFPSEYLTIVEPTSQARGFGTKSNAFVDGKTERCFGTNTGKNFGTNCGTNFGKNRGAASRRSGHVPGPDCGKTTTVGASY